MAQKQARGSTPCQRKPAETDLGFSWGTVNTALLSVGVVLIRAGYFALSRGSISLAPCSRGRYVVVVPAALVLLGRGGRGE